MAGESHPSVLRGAVNYANVPLHRAPLLSEGNWKEITAKWLEIGDGHGPLGMDETHPQRTRSLSSARIEQGSEHTHPRLYTDGAILTWS